MDVKSTFEVTEKAGHFVAGRRSPGAGQPILLTEAEAFHALQLGELRRPEKKGGKPAGKGGEGEGT
ncbi:hypothetical protein [Shinella sp.]|uniref:hypothetical protein n=1 Tax=Shinella sp. TaxID=1870904 RepID=UPI0039E39398